MMLFYGGQSYYTKVEIKGFNCNCLERLNRLFFWSNVIEVLKRFAIQIWLQNTGKTSAIKPNLSDIPINYAGQKNTLNHCELLKGIKKHFYNTKGNVLASEINR